MDSVTLLRKNREPGAYRVRENKKGDVCYLTFPVFDALTGFTHGFSTRAGGVSTGIFSSMNLTTNRGDSRENVWENFRRLSDAAGFSLDSVTCSHQTHTTNVRVMTREDRGGGLTKDRTWQDVDGMVTDVPDLTLMTFYADCIPLFFIDPVRRAIGLSHSGWRGTVGKIGLKTVTLMQKEFGSDPKDIYAAIGPGICADCYEISEDVAVQFREAFAGNVLPEILFPASAGKYRLDLWRANELILKEAGIPASQIEVTDICTCCNPKQLFSHRASGGNRGNLAGFLRLEPD
ncbi:MAG: peptidoglycan editing factor PgeF [Lachnospiraceae bacterium]|nr:peptidoglycan editing factor PgeF [Lachnospiraceae bacterium]